MTGEDTPEELDARVHEDPRTDGTEFRQHESFLRGSKVTEPLLDREQRRQMGFDPDPGVPISIMIELNLRHEQGVAIAAEQLRALLREVVAEDRAHTVLISNIYLRCRLSVHEMGVLVQRDNERPLRQRTIYRVWPDFPVRPLIYRTASTVKADAAQRSFNAIGQNITWAVIDSGIDATHPHFHKYETLEGDADKLHRDFTQDFDKDDPAAVEASVLSAQTDGLGHGTHVAGIIAGSLTGWPASGTQPAHEEYGVFDHELGDPNTGSSRILDRTASVDPTRLAGVAPQCKLVSLKVLDERNQSTASGLMQALEYVREINGNGKIMRIHGVNMSVGYPFLADWYACGQSPLCDEVNRLVHSGVVVVVAAGNTGYGSLTTDKGETKTGLSLTINDPGNAALCITVGATHPERPHTFGVSYFSSKGPTGDGRPKPDLVAPGERIISCATGSYLESLKKILASTHSLDLLPLNRAVYTDHSGTSMAAPHVSGAIAAFLSIRQEYVGRPDDVKRIFLESATSLGRERYFQGYGLVDLMRAIQSV